jgi:WhiB family redox-sensing transcriptional regulator
MDWKKKAACLGVDAGVFFPDSSDPRCHKLLKAAKAICEQCEVKEKCLEYALNTPELHGVWGGCSERQRVVLRRQRKANT